MKRILFVDLGSHYGGVETYLEGLIDMLRPQAECYALCSLPRLASNLRDRGVVTTCLPFLRGKWSKAFRVMLAFVIVPFIVLTHRIRIVQLNGYFETYLLLPLRILGCKSVYTMHGPFEADLYSWYRNPILFASRFISQYCVWSASVVVCVSETVGAIARTVLAAEKVHVIPNWVEVPVESKKVYAVQSPVRLLFVGRVERHKGVHLILEAIEELPGVSLLVVGDGSYRPELERLSQGLTVRFLGFQSHPEKFYDVSDIFVNPSLGPEGLPLVSLEAMAHGLPCIFSGLPVHHEISGEGRVAALFASGDALNLREQLRLLIQSEERRQTSGIKARDSVKLKYSFNVAAEQYLEVFAQIHGNA